MTSLQDNFKVSFISAADCRPLRMNILRPGQPAKNSFYPGDELDTSFHFGIREKQTDLLVCDGTFFIDQCSHFIKKNGYSYVGELFEIPIIGPHKVMFKWL